MMYFGDVRGRPAYCAAHVVPLESLPADLASAATTPDFAWITPDDCSDMGRLRTPRTASTRPSARRRSSWARPASGRATSPRSGTPIRVPAPAVQGSVVSSGARGGSPPTAWVANYGSATVTPIDTATRRLGRAIKVGAAPVALAITPNGRMIYVVSEGSSTVTPIATATNRPGAPITVGAGPRAIAMTPGGRIAYVLNWVGGSVTPIDTATGDALAPIPVGSDTVTPITIATNWPGPAIAAGYAPDSIAVTPDGTHVVVADGDSDQATVIDVRTRVARHVGAGYSPDAVAVSGSQAFVVNNISGTVTRWLPPPGSAARRSASACIPIPPR